MSELFEFSTGKNPKITSLIDGTVLKFYLTKKDLDDYDIYVQFINSIKSLVRKDYRYTNVKHRYYEIGLNRCQIHSGITSDMAPIEMHHGPIFDLFKICMIVTDHMLKEDGKANSFIVADKVLHEHERFNIQTVMLCETCHEAVENKSIFLPFEMGFGHLDKFIKKYKKGISDEHYSTIKDYLRDSKEYGYVDNGVYEILDKIRKYVKN